MKFRGLLAAVVVLLVLGGVLYWSQRHKPAANASSASSNAPNILKVNASDIAEMTVKRKGQAAVTLNQSSPGKWQITAPVPAAADSQTVSGMLSNLSPLASQRVVQNQSANLSEYGLNDPAVELDIKTKSNKTENLRLGDDTPTGDAVYASVAGDPRVFTAGSFVKTSLDKSEDDLRDKRLLPISADAVSGLQLDRKGQHIEFGRVKNGWQIEKPKPYRTDSYQVSDLLDQLVAAKWQPAQNGPDPAKAFVQGAPVATVKLTGSAGTDTLELRKSKDDYYAKSSAVNGVYKVDSSLGTALSKGLDDFRNKQLFNFGYTDPDKVEYHAGSTNLVLTHTGNAWWSEGRKMDPNSVESLITAVRDMAASKFVDSGYRSPQIEIAVTSDSGKKVEKAGIERTSGGGIGKRDNGPSLYFFDSTTLNDLASAADAVKQAAPAEKK